jgi:short subunit dehydrogenase-like uncharacterized protein
MTTQATWLLYGVTGYTGQRIAEEAVRRGLTPIVAGRNREKVAAIADRLKCPFRVFPLDAPEAIAEQLKAVSAVLHCAGPFSATARPMMEACFLARAHYLDLTGEIDVIEQAAAWDDRAKAAGVTVIPSVGFDVVPSDCLAAMLAARLPGATRLELAFASSGPMSPGTMKTMLEALPTGGRARIDGTIERVPSAWKAMDVAFPGGSQYVVSIPWGDVASAFYSTGIPNIETYVAMPRRLGRLLGLLRPVWPLLGGRLPQAVFRRLITRFVHGPTEKERLDGRVRLWGRATDAAGVSLTAQMVTPEGYHVTILTALASMERILAGKTPAGFFTPSKAFGVEFALTIPGVEISFATKAPE